MVTEFALVGGAIVLTLAGANDFNKTLTYTTAVITIRGATFISKKIAESTNKNHSELINLAGWCLAGIPIVGILVLAKHSAGLNDMVIFFKNVGNFFNGSWCPDWIKNFWSFGSKEQIFHMFDKK